MITTHDLFPDRFVKITKSVCFGDSGGPMFHEDTLVALNTWTFSTRCATESAVPRRLRASPVLPGRQPVGLAGLSTRRRGRGLAVCKPAVNRAPFG